MATYKVIQDIEAEDKLLGPLSLRQFIYAVIVIVQLFLAFKITTTIGNPLPFIFFLPTIVFFGLLAAPFGQNQSSEIWLLAKIRFFLKPRVRIWDQTGMKELVTITAPKTIEKAYTDGLTQTEVKSRLQALANTIDSRGWAVKNVNMNMSNPAFATVGGPMSDRLVAPSSLPQDVPSTDIYAADDIMDGHNNATAQALDAKLAQSSHAHLQAAIASTHTATTPQPADQQGPTNDYWFMNQPDAAAIPAGKATFAVNPAITPGSDGRNQAHDDGAAEQALLKRIHEERNRTSTAEVKNHSKVVQPLDDQGRATNIHTNHHKPASQHDEPVVKPVDPKLANLVNNNDLNISTIAHEASKTRGVDENDGEVVISLH